MFQVVFICSSLLATVASEPPPPTGPAKAAEAAEPKAPMNESAALAEYNARRERLKNNADAHWKLAVWCEQNRLRPEAMVHFAAVVQLDPGRTAAWRRLGFKKHNGRWKSEDQVKEEVELKKDLEFWAPRLEALHKWIHRGKRQAEAQAALAAIDDPKAVPAVFREFGSGAIDQSIAIQVLGQIPAAMASKALAFLAVYGASAEVRRRATETLRSREPEAYAAELVGLLVDPLKYEVRPVSGPGSPGVLFVEGERFNVRRYYAPPPPPNISIQPGDRVFYDQFGLPVIDRANPDGPYVTAGKVPGSKGVVNVLRGGTEISLAQNLLEAQRAAFAAQAQLQDDVAQVEAFNDARKKFNERITGVLKVATGKDVGDKPAAWKDWLSGAQKKYPTDQKKPKPTVDQLVTLAYNPTFGRSIIFRQVAPDH
jgi:hypothetical protein